MVHLCILAGASEKAYITGIPKCFLPLPTGECIVEEILHEIKDLKTIESIIVIGPEAGLAKLEKRGIARFRKRIFLIPQGKDIQENLILAKKTVVKKCHIKNPKRLGILYLFGDTPYRRKCSIEEFMRQVDKKDYDLAISFVHESIIKRYRKLFPKPLIPVKVNNVPGNYKETNMVFMNPDIIDGNLGKKIYQLRHTTRITTILRLRRLVKDIGGKEIYRVMMRGIFARQWHRALRRVPVRKIHSPRFLYKRLEKDELMRLVKERSDITMDILFSSYPDGYIDVDSLKDYRKIYGNYFSIKKAVWTDCRKVPIK